MDKKYCDRIEYTPNIHLIFGTNHAIRIEGSDTAFWNRLIYVPFDYSIPEEERDPWLLEKLWTERDAIVTQCVLAYQANPSFTQVNGVERLLNQWSGDGDSVDRFVRDCCELSPEARVYSKDLYPFYREYCSQKGYTAVGAKQLTSLLCEYEGIDTSRWRQGDENC